MLLKKLKYRSTAGLNLLHMGILELHGLFSFGASL